jgi:hypothetical protein
MVSLTKKEKEALLILLKDFTSYYNANSISKLLRISHVGAQKIFKRFSKENLVISKKIGKSIIYKLNFEDNYVKQLLSFLLADEANNFKRWKEEFKELFVKNRIVIIYGSAIKNYTNAKDIDVMVVMDNKDLKEVNSFIKEKEEILPKKVHIVKLTHKDLLSNIKKKDKVIIDIVKNAIVLSGQEEYVEALKDVTGF